MKKLSKKMMLMLTMMMLSLMMVVPAHAASMRISKKNATISVGGQVQLKVKGTKKRQPGSLPTRLSRPYRRAWSRGKRPEPQTSRRRSGRRNSTAE